MILLIVCAAEGVMGQRAFGVVCELFAVWRGVREAGGGRGSGFGDLLVPFVMMFINSLHLLGLEGIERL